MKKIIIIYCLSFVLLGTSIVFNGCKKDEPPVADFTVNTTSITEGYSVNFTDLSTNTPTSWSWDFGDGGISISQSPSHSYSTAGTYTVSLTATNAYGSDTETKIDYITVNSASPVPVADFTANTTSITEGYSINFTDLSTKTPTSWSWNFGDGGTSTSKNPSHSYSTAGTYTVSLTATNAYGSDTETKNNYITVNIASYVPVTNFTVNTTMIIVGGTVNFTDLSTNSPTSWSWNFGDGGTSTSENPSNTYSTEGTYTVSLTATNTYGSDTETKNNYITVTTSGLETGTLTDPRDAQIYNTVKIGNQWWMAENLNYDAGSGSWCYNDNSSNCATYGRLYNWEKALTVAPAGWHLPTDDEWITLTDYLGGVNVAGGKMKETGTAHWNSVNEGATNLSGFTALAGGYRHNNGSFLDMGIDAFFWSATEYDSQDAWIRCLYYYTAVAYRSSSYKTYGYSVRCVKDL